MISVDGRKGLGLGFGVGRDMEEPELEEGEACFYQNGDDDDDSTLDPDVALSYLDEKLQHVLGHFQKDFEGGVSAENLGSKFGGYGSFLPTYQRSPARTPPKFQNQNASRSPSNLHLEGGRCNSVSSSASISARHGSAAVRASSVDDFGKQVALSSIHAENKIDNPSDQKTLKVRIKVGSDNLSTRKNAEIYSGLGLDVSPTSSLEDSPTDSQLSRQPKNSPDESPTSILEIMTSFPVFGNLLLSPLNDDLICLTEKEKHFRDGVSASVMHKGSQESSHSALNGSSKGDRKTVGEKRPKPSEKKAFTMELKNDIGNNAQSGVDFKLEKESDLDTSACDELVSNALRLPFLSNSYSSVVDSANNKPLGFVSTQENGWDEKPNGKASLDGKCREFKKVNSDNDEYGDLVKEGNLRGEKNEVPSKADSNMPKGRKNCNVELMDPAKYKAGQKTNSYDDDDMKVATGKEHSSPGSRRKLKGSQSHGAQVMTEVPKDNVKTDILSAPKSRKIMNINTHLSNSDVEDIKKDDGKAKDRYKEFFGDLELEQGDDEIAEEIPSTNRPNNTPLVEKSACGFSNASKERSYGKKIDQPSTSESYARVASNVVPPTGNRPISETAAPMAPLVKEDWVCCDKCQKWRLLPVGTNPQSLPKIWLCSMLNWLDGMNRCGISEEETTKAVISLHQITASGSASGPEGQRNPNRYPGGTLSGGMAVDTLHVDQSHQDIGGKKKQGFKDGSHSTNQDASAPFSNSKKKNPQASVKSRSLNGENQSPSLNEADFQHSGQSNGFFGEKQRLKKKETSKLLENYEGDTKSLKIRNKREADQEFSKASKKPKTDAVHCTDEDRKSENGGTALKAGHSSSCGLSINKTREDRHKYDDHPKDSKQGSKISGRNPEDQMQFTSDAGSLHMGKYTDRNVKKRKVNEYQDTQLYTTSLGSGGNRLEDQRDFMEETSEDNQSKKMKARVSKSGEKENSIKEGSSGTDKKGRCVKDEQLGVDLGNNLSHRSLDAVDPIKRDMGLVQPSVAAASSSSKVSDSRKNTANFQEVKGSPVESVSSSPLRVFNQDKFGSTRRFSDGEDGRGSDRSGMVRKDGAITTTNRGSHESPMLDPQDRDLAHISSRKADVAPVPSLEFATHHVTDTVQGDQYSSKPRISDHCRDDESGKGNQYHANGSRRKSGKGSSSRSKDKSRGARSESDKGKLKESPYDEKSKARSKSLEKMALGSEKVQKNIISKKDPTGILLTESAKREGKPNSDLQNGSDIRQVILNQDSKQDVPLDRSAERSSKRLPSDRTDRVDASGKGKSPSLPPSGKGQNESTRWPQSISGSHKENGVSMMSSGDDALKAPKQIKPNGHKVRDIDAPSPVRRDSTSQAATNAVKEAKDLKHLADRLKNNGSNNESNVLYFQAALKFLHGASLLESCNGESSKHGEMIQSMQMYSSTAKLCEFCAHEYEKSKDMASAALAYKCVEVAYLRVINSSHANASKDRHELQKALQIVPPGESPSSSASDVDNLNNPVAMDKVTLAKGVSSPQVAGNHIITAQNRSNFVRLLNFAQDVNFAMEASRKSRTTFAAANSRLEDAKFREGMSSVKKALDFNFQDVEGLLRLVRLAMEAISR